MALNATELHEKELEPRELLWGKVLARREFLLLHAGTGMGKTQFAFSLACCLAGGSKFLGRECHPCRVLYADGEMGMHAMKELYNQMAASFPQFPGSMLTVDCYDDDDHKDRRTGEELPRPKISEAPGQLYWERLLEKHDVMVIDNLGKFASANPLQRDDDFRAWARASEWIQKWRARGKTFIVVHHQNKSGTGFSGGQKKEDDANICLGFYELKLENPTPTRHLEMRFEKVRGFGWPESAPLHVSFEIFDGRITWKHRSMDAWTQERIDDLKRQNLKTSQIAKQLGVSIQRVSKYVPTSYDDEDPIQQPLYETEDDDGLF